MMMCARPATTLVWWLMGGCWSGTVMHRLGLEAWSTVGARDGVCARGGPQGVDVASMLVGGHRRTASSEHCEWESTDAGHRGPVKAR